MNINVDWKKVEEKDYTEAYSLNFAVTLMGPVQAPAKPAGPVAPLKKAAAPKADAK